MQNQPTKKAAVYALIRKAILSGELKPGEILNEAELARRYGTGKTPTREALIVLTHEKFLEPMPRLGYMVTKTSIQDILETFHLRMVLEVEAIGLAVGRISDEQIAELENNNREEQEIIGTLSGSQLKEKAYELNRAFHLVIAQASGSVRLAEFIQQMIDDMERMLAVDPYLADPSQHAEILSLVKQHNRELAQEALRRHLEDTRSRILNRF
jgi:GntR family transcriptional regulator, rspAB operon transcriptional repressor